MKIYAKEYKRTMQEGYRKFKDKRQNLILGNFGIF